MIDKAISCVLMALSLMVMLFYGVVTVPGGACFVMYNRQIQWDVKHCILFNDVQ